MKKHKLQYLFLTIVFVCGVALNFGHADETAKSSAVATNQVDTSNASDELIINRTVSLNFKPVAVFFFTNTDTESAACGRGVIVPAFGSDSVLSETKKFLAGTKVKIAKTVKNIHYSLLIVGKERRFYFEPDLIQDLSLASLNYSTTDSLRERLLQRKEVLNSWQIQIKAQDASLERLREDANVIGNLDRIVDVKEDLDKANRDSSNLDRDLENLRNFIKLARSRPIPKNYVTREGQLTRQLSLLAEESKKAESQEFSRKSRAEGDLQRKLSLIEETRLDDYDELQWQLVKVRRQRMQLEKDMGSNDPRP